MSLYTEEEKRQARSMIDDLYVKYSNSEKAKAYTEAAEAINTWKIENPDGMGVYTEWLRLNKHLEETLSACFNSFERALYLEAEMLFEKRFPEG